MQFQSIIPGAPIPALHSTASAYLISDVPMPKSSDSSKFFSVSIAVRPNESGSDDGVSCCRMEKVKSVLHDYIRKNAIEGVLIQSVEGKCLTLSAAILFGASHARGNFQKHLRERHVLNCFKDRPNAVQVRCTVTTPREDERHAIYETLRQMVLRQPSGAAAARQGEAGQQGLLATSNLVLDTVPAAADPAAPQALSAGGVHRGAAAAPGGGTPAAAAQFLGRAPPPASAAAPAAWISATGPTQTRLAEPPATVDRATPAAGGPARARDSVTRLRGGISGAPVPCASVAGVSGPSALHC